MLGQVKGTVTSVTEVTRNGFDAFAVKVALNDGGTATGYVHKASGVVFDWDVVGPPAATSTNTGGGNAPAATTTTTQKRDDDRKEQKRPSSSRDDDEGDDDDD